MTGRREPPHWIPIDNEVSVGPQPSHDALHELDDAGFASVIDIRPRKGNDPGFGPHDEGELVRGEGLQYRHLTIDPFRATDRELQRFRRTLDEFPKPVFVHGRDIQDATALVLLDMAIKKGWSPEETMRRAHGRNLPIATDDQSELYAALADRLRRGSKPASRNTDPLEPAAPKHGHGRRRAMGPLQRRRGATP